MVEVPDAKKCCFCIPLRRGLLGVGYFKLVCNLTALGVLIFYTMLFVYYRMNDELLLTFTVISYITLLLDIIFTIMFIVSAHKKNYKYIRVYYYFSLAELVSYLIVLAIFISTIQFEGAEGLLIGATGSMFVVMVLHIYFIYLVRSEMRKLQLNTLFIFKSHVDEPECTAQIQD